MNLLLAIIALLVLLVSATAATRQIQRLRLRKAWQKLAPRLELSLTDARRLSGRFKGMPLEVILTGSSSQMRMAVQAELPPGLHLSRQKPGARRLRGVRDIQIGDKPLDDAALIQSENPAATIRLLREPAVRDALLEFLTEHPNAVVTGNEVVVPLEKKPDEELGRRVLRSQQRLAAAIEASANHLRQQALEAREQTLLEAAPSDRQLPERPQIKSPPSPSLRSLREIFRIRRWIHGLTSYPALFGGLLLIAATGGRKGPMAVVGFILAITGLVAQSLGGYFILRCPACGGALMKNTGGKAADFETKVCPHCQMRLS
ncbi:hypothetical protein [Hyalangium gracile]|uniref:hypothetical protein n=1 Tax=Hyalangium gracile TaxID=394092 RepID=UPI001CCADC25|nr:hypothetical protein [Hyalangium gracile]